MLYHLIYYSRNRLAEEGEALVRQIDAILAASRANNAAQGITGALIFNSGVFAQVLEGPRDRLEATFERIQQDERHADVQVLAFEPCDERAFSEWSMAFLGRSTAHRALFGDIGALTGFEERRLEAKRVSSIMREIALEEERAT